MLLSVQNPLCIYEFANFSVTQYSNQPLCLDTFVYFLEPFPIYSDDTEDSEEENEDMVVETDKSTNAVPKALAVADALGNQSAYFQR